MTLAYVREFGLTLDPFKSGVEKQGLSRDAIVIA
jgi:hypothetical protein